MALYPDAVVRAELGQELAPRLRPPGLWAGGTDHCGGHQAGSLGAGRELILRRTNWKSFSKARLEQVAQVVTETFVASIRTLCIKN